MPIPVRTPRCNSDDLFQLAHYQRLLEACGHQADEGQWGGIMGVGPRLAWYDLATERWGPSEYLDQQPPGPRSTMDAYEDAFAYRLAVADAALGHRREATVPLLAEPVLIPACDECGWRVWCFPRLEETADRASCRGWTYGGVGSTTNGVSPISTCWPAWTTERPGWSTPASIWTI